MRNLIIGMLLPLLCVLALAAHAQTVPACPGDKTVWVNTRSHIYHFEGERYFGRTKYGRFECEHQADLEGDRPTRNGQ